MKKTIYTVLMFLLFLAGIQTVIAQMNINVESGMVTTGYNDIRIPGDEGTLFSLNDDFNSESSVYFRLRGIYTFNPRHTISLLYAPLVVHSAGTTAKQINFSGTTFPSNTFVKASYKFNSYRATYRYDFIKNAKTEFGFGFTAKIRDAKIELQSPGLIGEKKNVGFVPILNFRWLWNCNDKLGLLLEGDALAAPQGRAEDVRIAAMYTISDNIGISAGYRILEGGADNDKVYSFALFHYLSVAFSYTF
jgi:hypothetical protein